MLAREHVIHGASDERMRSGPRPTSAARQLERLIDERIRSVPVTGEPGAARELDRNLRCAVDISTRPQLFESLLEEVNSCSVCCVLGAAGVNEEPDALWVVLGPVLECGLV